MNFYKQHNWNKEFFPPGYSILFNQYYRNLAETKVSVYDKSFHYMCSFYNEETMYDRMSHIEIKLTIAQLFGVDNNITSLPFTENVIDIWIYCFIIWFCKRVPDYVFKKKLCK